MNTKKQARWAAYGVSDHKYDDLSFNAMIRLKLITANDVIRKNDADSASYIKSLIDCVSKKFNKRVKK